LTQVSFTFSDNGGRSWSQPAALTDRTFHAGWGNDTGQPNLGDYNQAVAQNGEMFAVFAQASRPPAGFIDGQPTSASFTVPDVIFKRISGEDREHRPASVDLVSLNFTDSGGNGFIDANENISLRAVLRNYVTNLLNARRLREPRATLTTSTPNGLNLDSNDVAVVSVASHRPFRLICSADEQNGAANASIPLIAWRLRYYHLPSQSTLQEHSR